MYRYIAILLLCFGLLLSSSQAAETHIIRLATTTSTENSGLLHALLPAFERATGFRRVVLFNDNERENGSKALSRSRLRYSRTGS